MKKQRIYLILLCLGIAFAGQNCYSQGFLQKLKDKAGDAAVDRIVGGNSDKENNSSNTDNSSNTSTNSNNTVQNKQGGGLTKDAPVAIGRVALALGGAGKDPAVWQGGQTAGQVRVAAHIGKLVIIEAGTPHALVIPSKSQRFNQMQLVTRIGTQADDVAGVGRDFGLEQHYVQHADSSGQARC